jgi:membrane protein DedA with SNARE-associated domain
MGLALGSCPIRRPSGVRSVERVIDLSAYANWVYAVVALLVLADAVVPLVPSETALITGGVLAAQGHLWLPGLIGAAAAAAFCGDLISYRFGGVLGTRLRTRLLRRRWGRGAVAWTATRLHRDGTPLLIAARFVPGGRTASTLSAGFVGYPRRRFMVVAAVGGTLWASAQCLLGFLSGHVTSNPLVGVALASGVALILAVGGRLLTGSRRRPAPTTAATTTDAQPDADGSAPVIRTRSPGCTPAEVNVPAGASTATSNGCGDG